ncbi:hypothetical protein B0T16DRAFT_458691 [Cercophora newfieldiana]|uniref:NYN domain-containing protein n=1 Tax=Cercophora newfieldiana TaxID=92897 RepID=A0AA40CPR5_9PEZI|nr:hypothetical protein B0T16DRAFT_458691 [Cercophora newfieldiana]
MSANPQEIVRIYIDNSNLWIQGQKTHARKRNLKVLTDPTWRFHLGRLESILIDAILTEEAPRVTTHLYGSTPPLVDAIWNKFKAQGTVVRTYKRGGWTGREKGVDGKLIAESVKYAVRDECEGISSHVVIVSGDRDLADSAVAEILECGFPVHVWAWRNSLADIYRKMQEECERLHVHLLDDYMEAFGYCETTFRVEKARISPHSIVVLDPMPKADAIQELVSDLEISCWQYVNQKQRPNASSQDLIIIPVYSEEMSHDSLVDLFIFAKRTLEKHDLIVMTYLDYCQQYWGSNPIETLAVSNRFDELSDTRPYSPEKPPASSNDKNDPNDGFVTPNRQARKFKEHALKKEK